MRHHCEQQGNLLLVGGYEVKGQCVWWGLVPGWWQRAAQPCVGWHASLELLCKRDVIEQQQKKVILIAYLCTALNNIESLPMGIYWKKIISKNVVPLMKTRRACVFRFSVSVCGRTWSVLIFGLTMYFCFAFIH